MENRWITLKEAIEYSSLSDSTLRRLVKKGQIKSSKVTGKYLFKISWIDNFYCKSLFI